MSLLEAPELFIYARLNATTSVSSQIANRVFPVLPPAGADMPCVVYQRTNVERPRSLSGPVGDPAITIQVTTFGTSYTNVKSIARAVRLAVDNWTGTTAGVTIKRTTLVAEQDGVEVLEDNRMLPYYKVQQAYEFRITEAT